VPGARLPVSAEAELRRDGSIAIVLLNRPQRLNALDMDMARQLQEHLQVLALDKNTAAVLITGAGRAFCAGGDLAWASSQPDGVPPALHVLAGHLHQSLLEIHGMDKPVIAAVNGTAAGAGFSLALACDFRVLDGIPGTWDRAQESIERARAARRCRSPSCSPCLRSRSRARRVMSFAI
jgi:2-(1,2-epoxy-1,2-dihydrophenyl)acetyl-CoA isomerase